MATKAGMIFFWLLTPSWGLLILVSTSRRTQTPLHGLTRQRGWTPGVRGLLPRVSQGQDGRGRAERQERESVFDPAVETRLHPASRGVLDIPAGAGGVVERCAIFPSTRVGGGVKGKGVVFQAFEGCKGFKEGFNQMFYPSCTVVFLL